MKRTRLHHVGYVTASIADSVQGYVLATGLQWDGRIIREPLQMVNVAFLGDDGGGAAVELVELAGRRSPVNRFLAAGGGLHHICLEVPDLAAHLATVQAGGCTLVRVPLPAAAFNGRKIAWITTPSGDLIELLQAAV